MAALLLRAYHAQAWSPGDLGVQPSGLTKPLLLLCLCQQIPSNKVLHTEVGGCGAPDPGGPDNQSQLLSQQEPSEENVGTGNTRDRVILNQVQEVKVCTRNQIETGGAAAGAKQSPGLEQGLPHLKALLLGALGASGAPGRRAPSGPRPSAPKCGPRASSFHMAWSSLASDSDSML